MVFKRCLSSQAGNAVVLIDGVRSPFQKINTGFALSKPHKLMAQCFDSLIERTKVPVDEIDIVYGGIVVEDSRVPNTMRQAVVNSKLLPSSVGAATINTSCLSSMSAVMMASDAMAAGTFDTVIVAGAEITSSYAVTFKPRLEKLIHAVNCGFKKSLTEGDIKNRLLNQLKPSDFAADDPFFWQRETSTGYLPGYHIELANKNWNISRAEQDELAFKSHRNAFAAQQNGHFDSLIFMAKAPIDVDGLEVMDVCEDNGIMGNTSKEKLAKLKPVFVPDVGTLTAGNSSFQTDGVTAALLMTEKKAKALGLKPKAYVRDFAFSASEPQEPFNEMLYGPAFSIPKLLKKLKRDLKSFDVYETHEAFAAQALICLAALDSERFCHERLGMPKGEKIGYMPTERMNLFGGSIALGHPFGATGLRLMMHAADRMIHEDGETALINSCAHGALGGAMYLERAS